MIIDRFGATYAGAYVLPTLKAEDDWAIERPEVLQRVGGMNGAFDFYGDRNYPIGPLSIRKTFTLTDRRGLPTSGPGTGTITIINGFTTVAGVGTAFLTEFEVGNALTVGAFTAAVVSISDDENLFVDTTPAADIVAQAFTITRQSPYAYLDTLLDRLMLATIAAGESKLWGLLRDGTRRWTWAKCVHLKPPENYANKLARPIEIGFTASEGQWYAEDESSLVITDAGFPYTFTLTNRGTLPALLKCVIANGATSYLTLPKLENLTNGQSWTFDRAGSTEDVRLSHTLSVDAAAQAVTDDAADAYASLSLETGQTVFMQLEPGDNSMRFTGTFSSATEDYTATLTWHDTYL